MNVDLLIWKNMAEREGGGGGGGRCELFNYTIVILWNVEFFFCSPSSIADLFVHFTPMGKKQESEYTLTRTKTKYFQNWNYALPYVNKKRKIPAIFLLPWTTSIVTQKLPFCRCYFPKQKREQNNKHILYGSYLPPALCSPPCSRPGSSSR